MGNNITLVHFVLDRLVRHPVIKPGDLIRCRPRLSYAWARARPSFDGIGDFIDWILDASNSLLCVCVVQSPFNADPWVMLINCDGRLGWFSIAWVEKLC